MSARQQTIDLIRDSPFIGVLRKYIAPALFSDTNIPSVSCIFYTYCSQNGQEYFERKIIVSEDIELALSVYAPGNVTLRMGYACCIPLYRYRHPALAPLNISRSSRSPSDSVQINRRSTLGNDALFICSAIYAQAIRDIEQNIIDILPDSCQKFLDNENVASVMGRYVAILRPIAICLPEVLFLDDLGFRYLLCFNPYRLFEYSVFSRCYRERRPIRYVNEKSSAYPLWVTRRYTVHEMLDHSEELLEKICRYIGDEIYDLALEKSSILKGVYGVNASVATCMYDPRRSRIIKSERYKFVKFFVQLDSYDNNPYPIILGFTIDKTDELVTKIHKDIIVRLINELKNPLFNKYYEHYVKCMLGDIYLGYLNQYVFSNFNIQLSSLIANHLPMIMPLILLLDTQYALLNNDFIKLESDNLIHNYEELLRRGLAILRYALSDLRKLKSNTCVSTLSLGKIIAIVLLGKYSIRYLENLAGLFDENRRNSANDNFAKLLDGISSEIQNLKTWPSTPSMITLYSLYHTLNHHLLKTAIKWGGGRDKNLSELTLSPLYKYSIYIRQEEASEYNEEYNYIKPLVRKLNRKKAFAIYENSNGGLNILLTTLRSLVDNPVDLFNELVFSLGECTVGGAEDIVYYGLLTTNIEESDIDIKIDIITKSILDSGVKSLKVPFTELEYSEARRLLLKLLNITSRDLNLLKKVVKRRYELEDLLGRTPLHEELIMYLLFRDNLLDHKYFRRGIMALARRYSIIYRNIEFSGYATENAKYCFLTVYRAYINSELGKDVGNLHDTDEMNKLLLQLYSDVIEEMKSDNKIRVFLNKVLGDENFLRNTLGRSNNIIKRNIVWGFLEVLVDLGRIIRVLLLDLLLLTCPSACGWCYVSGQCSEAPINQQSHLLNRKLLKVFAGTIIEKLENKVLFEDEIPIGKVETGIGIQVGDRRYKLCLPEKPLKA